MPSVTTDTKTKLLISTLFDHITTMLDNDDYPITATIYTADGKIISILVNNADTSTDTTVEDEIENAIAHAQYAYDNNDNLVGALQELLEVLGKRSLS